MSLEHHERFAQRIAAGRQSGRGSFAAHAAGADRRGDDDLPRAATAIPVGPIRASFLNRMLRLSSVMACIRCLDYHGPKEHMQFIAASMLNRAAFLKLAQPAPGSALARLLADRPQYVSLLTAPYIDARWSSSVRADRLIEHVSMLRGEFAKYDFSVAQALHLLDLDEFALPGYAIVIDKPMWFCYEGLITLNLFKGRFRFFSVTFSFFADGSGTGIIIGGVQGRKTDDILARYREFTKLAQGLRPRDFLLEVLRMIARAEHVDRVVGISDRFRYHRHSYFTKESRPDLHLDYDQIWQDRGGVPTGDGLYDLPLQSDRDPGGVSAKRRAMHRRRYAMLDRLETRIAARLGTVTPVDCGQVD